MAETILSPQQSAPAAGVLTDLYTVPADTTAVLSTIVWCNRSSTPDTARVSLAPAGAADAVSQYLYYDLPMPGNDTFAATIGVTLSEGDVVRVYSLNGTCSFSAFLVEEA